MKKLIPLLGIILIIIGTLVLIATRFGTLNGHNLLLFIGLACIIAGIWLHICSIKRESNF